MLLKLFLIVTIATVALATPPRTCLHSGYPADMSVYNGQQSPYYATIVVPEKAGQFPDIKFLAVRARGFFLDYYPSTFVKAEVMKGAPEELTGTLSKDFRNPRTISLSAPQKFELTDGPGTYTLLLWTECNSLCPFNYMDFYLDAFLLSQDSDVFVNAINSMLSSQFVLEVNEWVYVTGGASEMTEIFVEMEYQGIWQVGAKADIHIGYQGEIPNDQSGGITKRFSAGKDSTYTLGFRAVKAASIDTPVPGTPEFEFSDKVVIYVNIGYGTEPIEQDAISMDSCFVIDNKKAVEPTTTKKDVKCDKDGKITDQCDGLCFNKGGYKSCTCNVDDLLVYQCNGALATTVNECAALSTTCRDFCGKKVVKSCQCSENKPSFECLSASSTTSGPDSSASNAIVLTLHAVVAALFVVFA